MQNVWKTFFKNIVRKQPLNIIVHLFVYKKVCVQFLLEQKGVNNSTSDVEEPSIPGCTSMNASPPRDTIKLEQRKPRLDCLQLRNSYGVSGLIPQIQVVTQKYRRATGRTS